MTDASPEGGWPPCPDCGGPVDGEQDGYVSCRACGETFRVLLVPSDRRSVHRCPVCSDDLRMGSPMGSHLVCTSCTRRWEIEERTWLDPVTDDS